MTALPTPTDLITDRFQSYVRQFRNGRLLSLGYDEAVVGFLPRDFRER